jgi:type IV pilus assembly protein PilM
LNSLETTRSGLDRVPFARRLGHWLGALPHPSLVCEIAPTHVAAARWRHRRLALDASSVEPLEEGVIVPSPIEANIVNREAVRSALQRVLNRISGRGPDVALLVPDPVVRVFILPFDTFPRRQEEGLALLRWRLKKSVPFDIEETIVSGMRQQGRTGGVEIVAALARQKILQEYESILEACGLAPGVVLSSTLAALPLMDAGGATLLARSSGRSLTTAIAQGETLCVFRTTEMTAVAAQFEPRQLLDEIFPAIAYYQDTWGGNISRVRLGGLGDRFDDFQNAVGAELGCAVLPLDADRGDGAVPVDVENLMRHDLDALVGWALNRGA